MTLLFVVKSFHKHDVPERGHYYNVGSKGVADACTGTCTDGESTTMEEIMVIPTSVGVFQKATQNNPTAHTSLIAHGNGIEAGSKEDHSNAKAPNSSNKHGAVSKLSSPHDNNN